MNAEKNAYYSLGYNEIRNSVIYSRFCSEVQSQYYAIDKMQQMIYKSRVGVENQERLVFMQKDKVKIVSQQINLHTIIVRIQTYLITRVTIRISHLIDIQCPPKFLDTL